MRFEDIPADILSFRVKTFNVDYAFDKNLQTPVQSIRAALMEEDVFELRLEDRLLPVKTVNIHDAKRLGNELQQGASHLVKLANPASDGSFDLLIATFPGDVLEMENLEIGVDEFSVEALNRVERRSDANKLSASKAYGYLADNFVYHHVEYDYFFMYAGPALEIDLEKNSDTCNVESDSLDDDDNLEPEETKTPKSDDNKSICDSFCVVGNELRFIATKQTIAEGAEVFVISKLTSARNYRDRCLRLARGSLKFLDYSSTGKIGLLAKAQLEKLTQESSSYLKKWDAYGNEEGEMLLKNARHFGIISFRDKVQNKDGTVTVTIEASENSIADLKNNKIESLCIVEEIPAYLDNLSMTFPEFVNGILASIKEEQLEGENVSDEKPSQSKKNNRKDKVESYDIISYSYQTSSLVLDVDDLPCHSGQMVMSLIGEIAQIKRRMVYRRLILEGRSANPQLGLLIEENGQISRLHSPHKIKPLSGFVREKIFSKPPTIKQEEAIRIALNTPDIALIQGPPGTGKTTVIAAILERLNEESDKQKSGKGRILLSGLQHDAVENMIERMTINGLPVPKFGQRSGAEKDSDYTRFQDRMEEWCDNTAKKIREKNHKIPSLEKEVLIKSMCIQYVMSPSAEYALKLVKAVLSVGIGILGQELFEKASKLEKFLTNSLEISSADSASLNAIRGLRTKKESFCDDGPVQAEIVLDECKDYLSQEDISIIQMAADWLPGDELTFLKDLEKVKRNLLISFTRPPSFTVEKHNQEVLNLAEDSVKRIRSNGFSAKDKKSAALLDFLSDLESNPYGMIDAIADYSFAFSATCQQCVNKLMQTQKGVFGDNNEAKLEYDYVIVDEAARVSPRDLLIPMAQGKKIILVGDHRQLPHIIDDAVAREMEAGEANLKEAEWLKKSMFQYLFSERLKKLEELDPEHPRRVTLDTQYRMHPVLGDFISRNFYERFDPNEKFGSGRPAQDFFHNLPHTENKPAAWLEVPRSMGSHEREETSWIRRCEAKAIANQLREWMESEPGKNLSYGVISFYKAQADLIKKLFTHQFDSKKLRIGTVDSFQGMEFDVVFLSMVRTRAKIQIEDSDREMAARKLFGHLCLYNRLNVSMSRQKKMLVVVGDSDLLKNDLADEFIPGLVDFYKLCQNEGVILSCR